MTQKEKAVECMKRLLIFEPFIKAFIDNGSVTLFERTRIAFTIKEDSLLNEIKQFEKRTGALVYAVTHEFFDFGECYTFLCVSKYEEDWPYTVVGVYGNCLCEAYCLNKTNYSCSEFGTVAMVSYKGFLIRRG